MPVPRADGKSQTAIDVGCGVEVAHCMNDMIETGSHVPVCDG
jgi:hypothetical protein